MKLSPGQLEWIVVLFLFSQTAFFISTRVLLFFAFVIVHLQKCIQVFTTENIHLYLNSCICLYYLYSDCRSEFQLLVRLYP